MSSTQGDALARLSTSMSMCLPDFLDDLTAATIHDIVAFQGDQEIQRRLRAGIDATASVLIHLMQCPGDLKLVEPPSESVEFALWLAQRGIPFSALTRGYSLCTARFYDRCLQEMAKLSDSGDVAIQDARRLSLILHSHVDDVSGRISKSYDAERERWLRQSDVTRADRVRAVLNGDSVDIGETEADLNYLLRRHHLGLIAWNTSAKPDRNGLRRLQHLVTLAADELNCPDAPLILPRDNTTVWAWLPVTRQPSCDIAATLGNLGHPGHPRIAFGQTAAGIGGFARTHRQAMTAHGVALLAGANGPSVTPYDDIAAISFLCGNIDAARQWSIDVLGGLVEQTEQNQLLRETLRVFLECGNSFIAAAKRLHCHKNTVQYRIRKAEATRGQPVHHRRLDLELALRACEWVGDKLLTNTDQVLDG